MPNEFRTRKLDEKQFKALDLKLNGINGAINRLSDNLGKWLGAIALAVSTPEDNSAEVQKKIDEISARVKKQVDALEGAADSK